MNLVKLGAAVLNQTPLDWDGNQRRITTVLRQARAEHVSLLCLPEMCVSGYGCEDALMSASTTLESQAVLESLLPETRGMVVSVGLPVLHQGALYNAAAVLADGHLVGLAAKRHLAGDGIHYEPRWFKPWPEAVMGEVELLGRRVPMGDILFELGGVRLGFEICEDAWVASRPGVALARAGVDVIFNPSASHFAFGKTEIRKRFVLEGSRAFGVSYVYANLLGNEAGRAIYDGGAVIATDGRMLAAGPRFSFAETGLTTAVVDILASRAARARIASFQPDPAASRQRVVSVPVAYTAVDWQPEHLEVAAWEHGSHLKEEEMLRAEALALWDYLRKSRTKGFVVSLSGGCDSAAVLALIFMSWRAAIRELGRDEVLSRLAHIPVLAQVPHGGGGTDESFERAGFVHLVTTAYQGTAQSSEVTRGAAKEVAAAVGSRHVELDVEDLVQRYLGLVSNALERPLSWEKDDLALQNIQARVRGPSVWLMANLEGKLLLTTSNRSEAAAGYATMDGDTCGGLAPIAGIDKAYLRRWLAWLATKGGEGLGPLPALRAVVSQRSTPELRPSAARQVSEEDLMPFDVLDVVERLAIRDKLPPVDVFMRLRRERPHDEPRQLGAWIERFFKLFAANQWKRERYAPSFHLDDENLDPKTWCRFPILSGGFVRELAALRLRVAEVAPPLPEPPTRGESA